jgi:hypothetical protein
MRAGHLYTGLFLVPWMMVYALSGFFLNHESWFAGSKPVWVDMTDTKFVPDATFPPVSEDQAWAILTYLKLDGAHKISQDDAKQMVIYRQCATGYYQVTWFRQESRLMVRQQQPSSAYSVINALHFQHGYSKPYSAYLPWGIWAMIVDVVTVSTVFWVISGVYIWARRPRKRLLGGGCLVAGCLLFAFLALSLSR